MSSTDGLACSKTGLATPSVSASGTKQLPSGMELSGAAKAAAADSDNGWFHRFHDLWFHQVLVFRTCQYLVDVPAHNVTIS